MKNKKEEALDEACKKVTELMHELGLKRTEFSLRGHGRIVVKMSGSLATNSSARWIQEEDNYLLYHHVYTSVYDMASALGRTEDAVRVRASRLGLVLTRQPRKVSEGVAEYIVENHKTVSLRAMAVHLQVSASTVYQYLKRIGLNGRCTAWDAEKYQTLGTYLREKKTHKEIAYLMGTSASKISYRVDKLTRKNHGSK